MFGCAHLIFFVVIAKMSTKFKRLISARTLAMRQLQELKKVADSASGEEAVSETFYPEFKARYNFIERIYTDFYVAHNEILGCLAANDENTDEHDNIRSEFDRKYYEIHAIYATTFAPAQPALQRVVSVDSQHSNTKQQNVKLPKMELVKFSGELKSWKTFIDLFNSAVHNQTNISNVEKFSYLISCLSKEPLSIVSRVPLTADNYQTAYDALVKRYDNKRLLATAYWQQIENAPAIIDDYTSTHLRQLLNTFDENLQALKTMHFPVDHWDFILFNMVMKRLPSSLSTRFELNRQSQTDIPTYKLLNQFLDATCQAMDNASLDSAKPSTSKLKYVSPPKPKSASLFIKSEKTSNSCSLCADATHPIYKCPVLLDKSPELRFNLVKQNKLCINCLGNKHHVKHCNSTSVCRQCSKRHHTLLHFSNNTQPPAVSPAPANKTTPPMTSSMPELQPQASVSSLTSSNLSQVTVLLSTAIVDVLDQFGSPVKIRIILDSASQSSFISENCANRLGLLKQNLPLSIKGLGGKNTCTSKMTTCTIRPVGQTCPSFRVEAVVIPKICDNMPSAALSKRSWPHIVNLKLADEQFYQSSAIDMLLGADLFPFVLEYGIIQGHPHEPTAINTKFGWILMGKVSFDSVTNSEVNSFCLTTEQSSLELSFKKFWEIEEPPRISVGTAEENLAENIFETSHSRDDSGRFVVPLLFKETAPLFPGSYSIAFRRLVSLERRLAQNLSLCEDYIAFMRDYLDSGHMELLSNSQPSEGYYIPHHCILKVDSPTTKLRVVFDASCKSENGMSLNSSLLIGPKLQKDIAVILTQFRCHKFVFTADIRQMYRQILVLPEERKFQKILWRFSPSDPIQEYQLNTVTYGVASSPYLALKVLSKLAHSKQDFSSATNVLCNDVYMDDIITGSFSIQEGLRTRDELIKLLRMGGFELRKWASNDPALLDNIPDDYRLTHSLKFDLESNSVIKILGIYWDPQSDCFKYQITPLSRSCTKRTLLSELARIFDPVGFLAPLTFFAKRVIQILWTLGLDWDDVPPADIVNKWLEFRKELPCLSELTIPRMLHVTSSQSSTLHGFCDASELGYGAVIYLRTVSNNDVVDVKLVTAKTKVAPLKKLSIPRLELCGALLLAKLLEFAQTVFKNRINIDSIYAWSDSTVALTWLRSSPHRWHTFVGNRVAQIQDIIPPSSWYHVRSEDNAADCASRGLTPSQLLAHSSWWAGPSFLYNNDFFAYRQHDSHITEILPEIQAEERKIVLIVEEENDIITTILRNYSSLDKISAIIAWCLRFAYNCRHRDRVKRPLSDAELQQVLIILAKHAQLERFSREIENMSVSKPVSKPLRKLSPFLDTQGVLRVGGRLKQSALSYDAKHQILLPSDHRLTQLIIEQMHKRYLHPGVQTLHYLLKQRFWIVGAKRAIARVVYRCLRCWKVNPKPIQPVMGDLPKLRISQLKAFSCVGVDYCGPFYITLSKSRGTKCQKAYICLFVCFATKAIHLELASDLSSEAFLCALRRFIARRGRCSYIFSDCGTNFVGAFKEINILMQNAVETEKLVWHFNPPSAPHFGGIWEAGVKSVKTNLARVVGEQRLTYEEFYTVLTQIEAGLNSRPLCPLSSDPNDLCVLTPGHFLTLEPISALPESDLSHLKLNRLSRWQLLQRLHQNFWSRWSREYLHTLQQRGKWNNPTKSPTCGDLVVIKNDLVPPSHWKLARVIETHPGVDGVVRVVTLRTAQGTIKRPVVKVCPLPSNCLDL